MLFIWLLASEVKVGVTRKTQVPTRWIDQGATQAIAIVEVPNQIFGRNYRGRIKRSLYR